MIFLTLKVWNCEYLWGFEVCFVLYVWALCRHCCIFLCRVKLTSCVWNDVSDVNKVWNVGS